METETIYGLAGFGMGIGVSYAYFRTQIRTQIKSLLNSVNDIFQKANDINKSDKLEILLFRDSLKELRDFMSRNGAYTYGISSYKSSIENKLMEED